MSTQRCELTLADGTRRWYLFAAPRPTGPVPPEVAERGWPLLIDLHGFSEGAELHALVAGFADRADAGGYLCAVPHGAPVGADAARPPQWATTVGANADVEFVEAVIDEVAANDPVDLGRVYLVGFSNGGLLTAIAMTHLAHRIAAAAVVGAGRLPTTGAPAAHVPLLCVHGALDPIVPIGGGPMRTERLRSDADLEHRTDGDGEDLRHQDPQPAPAVVGAWARRHGARQVAITRTNDRSHRYRWMRAGSTVAELHVVDDCGHTWPGSRTYEGLEEVLGPSSDAIDATELVWGFLSAHRLALAPPPAPRLRQG